MFPNPCSVFPTTMSIHCPIYAISSSYSSISKLKTKSFKSLKILSPPHVLHHIGVFVRSHFQSDAPLGNKEVGVDDFDRCVRTAASHWSGEWQEAWPKATRRDSSPSTLRNGRRLFGALFRNDGGASLDVGTRVSWFMANRITFMER